MRFERTRREGRSQGAPRKEDSTPAPAPRESIAERLLEQLGFSQKLAAANFGAGCIVGRQVVPEVANALVRRWQRTHHPDARSGRRDSHDFEALGASSDLTPRRVVDLLNSSEPGEDKGNLGGRRVPKRNNYDAFIREIREGAPLRDVTLEIVDAKKLIELCIRVQRQEGASRRSMRSSEGHFLYLTKKLLDFGPLEPDRRSQYRPFCIEEAGCSVEVVEPKGFQHRFFVALKACASRGSTNRPEFQVTLKQFLDYWLSTDGRCWKVRPFQGSLALLQDLWGEAINSAVQSCAMLLMDAAEQDQLRLSHSGDLSGLRGELQAKGEIEKLPSVFEEFLLNERNIRQATLNDKALSNMANRVVADSRLAIQIDSYGVIEDNREPGVPLLLATLPTALEGVKSMARYLLELSPERLNRMKAECTVAFSPEFAPRFLFSDRHDGDFEKYLPVPEAFIDFVVREGGVPCRSVPTNENYKGLLVSRRWDGSRDGSLVLEGFVLRRLS